MGPDLSDPILPIQNVTRWLSNCGFRTAVSEYHMDSSRVDIGFSTLSELRDIDVALPFIEGLHNNIIVDASLEPNLTVLHELSFTIGTVTMPPIGDRNILRFYKTILGNLLDDVDNMSCDFDVIFYNHQIRTNTSSFWAGSQAQSFKLMANFNPVTEQDYSKIALFKLKWGDSINHTF